MAASSTNGRGGRAAMRAGRMPMPVARRRASASASDRFSDLAARTCRRLAPPARGTLKLRGIVPGFTSASNAARIILEPIYLTEHGP